MISEKSKNRKIEKFFINKNIMAKYGNNKCYWITDVCFNKLISDKFECDKFKSYEDYYY